MRNTRSTDHSRAARESGFVVTMELLLIFAILVIGTIAAVISVRNALIKLAETRRAAQLTVKDSNAPPLLFGTPVSYDLCEAPQILCPDFGFDPGNLVTPGDSEGLRALVGIRPDRFVTRNQIYFTGPNCTGTAYIAPPAIPGSTNFPPTLPVGYFNCGIQVDAAGDPVCYGVGPPGDWGTTCTSLACATGGLLYRSSSTMAALTAVRSTWVSLAPDCALGASCITPPVGMVSWWPGDDTEADIQDGNDGTGGGGAAYAPGQVGDAFVFNGSSEVLVPSAANLSQQTFSIDAWVMPGAVASQAQIVVNKESAPVLGSLEYEIGIRGTGSLGGTTNIPAGNLIFFVGTPVRPCEGALGDGSWCDGFGAVPVGLWTHVALTFDSASGTATAYVNGVATRTLGGFTGVIPATGGPFRIGARNPGGGQKFTGLIDEVEFFRRPISGVEVAAIFGAGGEGKCKVCQTFPSLVSLSLLPALGVTDMAGMNVLAPYATLFKVMAPEAPTFGLVGATGETGSAPATGPLVDASDEGN